MNPLVSIIVPIYKVEKYIKRCAVSVFSQSYDNLEFIFVDDCTPDSSISILESVIAQYPDLQSRITLLHHQKNSGSGAARKTGFTCSTGEYIIYVDSDDYVEPTYIEELVKSAQESGADITICDYFKDKYSEIVPISVNPSLDSKELLIQIIKSDIHPSLWNKLIRRTIYTDHNLIFYDGMDIGEDKAMSFRCAYFSKKIAYTPTPLYHYCYNSTSLTNDKQLSLKAQADTIKVVKLMQDFAKEHNFDRQLLKAIIDNKSYQLCKTALIGDIKYYKSTCSFYDDISANDIRSSSMAVCMYKVAGIALHKKMFFTVSFLRRLYKWKHA